ncbi:uncharacterized protein LOC126846178 [Adelges cooleyi]|uniref:uncharacterized protein LOC126846178 n=1 Tax=Adelges cooleyi TaxID=133065 RepID=UPI002180664C|nr:uncharacterized protein LOC126846178 [Adelges cooleyi]
MASTGCAKETDDKKTKAKKGWTEKHSSFNKTETETICVSEAISRPINRLVKTEKKSARPTANPTTVCLKAETLHESKEEFAQRLRQAWTDREKSKSCINIYLARNVVEDPSMEITGQEVPKTPAEGPQRHDSGRAALEVQLPNNVAESEESCDEEKKPLSAAARRVRFYKNSKKQNDRQHVFTRAMSAPSTRPLHQQNSAQGTLHAMNSRRQEIHRFQSRKLKSCRSKAFHKSIDTEGQQPNARRAVKKNQNAEVITMMSLLSPVGSDTEDTAVTDQVPAKTVTFPQFSSNIRYHQKSFDSAVQSIEKQKPSNNNRTGKSLIKSRTIDSTREDEDAAEKTKVAQNLTEIVDVEVRADGAAEMAVCPNVADGQPLLQSDKEKECWALFKKMTDKGVSVTFDTILRGMLTPTEYRLRKSELLSYG